jgi:hypothetical protein
MFLGSYAFDGDPAELLPAYERMLAQIPVGDIALHVCVVRDHGLLVLDSCPSRADFDAFTSSEAFSLAVRDAGLPHARIVHLGEVHRARLSHEVSPENPR